MTDERHAARQAVTVAVLLVDADAPDEQRGRRLQEAVVSAAFDAGAGARRTVSAC